MVGIIDLIGEIGTAFPYLFRAWYWLVSRAYRAKVKKEYLKHSRIYIGFDIVMSLLFFGIECWGIVMGVSYIVASNT